jgi:uncharacterized protein (TIRG00374 family)
MVSCQWGGGHAGPSLTSTGRASSIRRMQTRHHALRPRRAMPLGVQLFASAQDEQRARRPTDVVLAVASALFVVLCGGMAELLGGLERSFAELVVALPGFFDVFWRLLMWSGVLWSATLIIAAAVRRRTALARDLGAAALGAIVIAIPAAAIVFDDERSIFASLFDVDGPPSFPPGLLAVSTAVIATASPHLSRPFRHLGRWLIASQLVATVLLLVALPTGAAAAIAIGLLAAAIVHLVVGSPGGRPTESRIRLALAQLGVDVDELAPAAMQRQGTVLFEGRDRDGPLHVKVYGRDAWDAQLLANLWRLAWYRGAERTTRLSRVELVEHEGFVTLLAERAGVDVPRIVTAGSAGRGDALVVTRPAGRSLATIGEPFANVADVDEASITELWHALDRLHDAGLSHGRIDLDRVQVTSLGTLVFGDLSSASVSDEPADEAKDQAQVFALSLLVVGEDRAVELARGAVGDESLQRVLPYVQEAAMPPLVRDALAEQDVDLDHVRARFTTTLGAEDQPLIRLRRVTVGSLVNLALMVIAAYTLIALVGGLDLDAFIDALQDANWWWLAAALPLAQIPRIPGAVSTMGAISRPLPLGPLITLQFAICYVNLAIPSTAARVAINVRFLQRFGIPPTMAVSAGVIDSVSGFVVQIVLFLLMFFWSDIDFGLSSDTGDLSGLATIALIMAIVIVAGAVLVVVIPALRRRLLAALRQVRDALRVLRSPTKLLQLFGGNLVGQVLFAVAFGACVRAFGYELPLSELVMINTVVSLFAGLLPVPGGIGVSEAGLTLGLSAAGLPSEIAFAAAVAYRFASFYLPPIGGWFCYQWLVQRRFL